jgi:hypothetical protein
MYWGLRLAAWNVPKMKSMPHGLSAGNAHFPALDRQGKAWFFVVLLLSDKVSTGAGNS